MAVEDFCESCGLPLDECICYAFADDDEEETDD